MIDGAGERRVCGAIHVHSTISYDGQRSIAELAAFFQGRGLDFVCVTEHSDGLTAAELTALVEACAAASSDRLLLVPGIEFSCRRRLHLLGIGVTEPIDSDEPVRVAEHIRAHAGVAVVAHPLSYGTDYPDDMGRHVDGLEVWNITKDGWFAPGAAHLRLWERWRRDNPALRGFGALDLHDLDSPAGLVVELSVTQLTRTAVLEALRSGPMTARGRFMGLSGDAPPRGPARWAYLACGGAYRALRRLRNRLQAVSR